VSRESRARARQRRHSKAFSLAAKIAALVIVLAGAAWAFIELRPAGVSFQPKAKPPTAEEVPTIDTTAMERRVEERLTTARNGVLKDLSSAAAWGRYGIVLDAHEMYDGAVKAYRTAWALDPKDFRWPYLLSRVIKFTDGDDSPEIVPFYEAAMKLRPDYAPLQVRYGDSLLRLNRVDDARKAYERAIKLQPNFWIAHRGLGQALIQAGQAEPAVEHLEKAVSLKDDGVSYAALARAYLLAGKQEQAAVAAAKSRDLKQIHTFDDPVLAEIGTVGISSATCFKRGRELIELGRYQEALDNLEITSEVLKDHPLVLLSMGACYDGMKQPEKAIEYFERSLAISDKVPDLHVKTGALLVERGRYPEAIVHFRKALAIADSASTRAHLAAALGHTGQLKEAAAEFDRAQAAGAQLDAAFQNNWGSVLAQQGLYLQAIPHFREACRLNPQFSSAYFNWGRALEDAGNPSEAIKVFEVAARFDPQGPAVRRIRELTANAQLKR
jgi:tetratricopeptide (TPR) repeat protein